MPNFIWRLLNRRTARRLDELATPPVRYIIVQSPFTRRALRGELPPKDLSFGER